MPRPNIVLIQADQWRGDCLSYTGHPVVETPHLDLLCRTGVHGRRVYAAVPTCIASRASLWTGQTHRTHGRVGYRDRVRWNYPVTLAGTLAEAGYHTQAVGKMHVYPERNLLGFHNVILHDGYLHSARSHTPDHHRIDDYLPWLRERHGPAADYINTGLGCNGYVVAPWCYDINEHPTAWVTSQSVDFLRRRDPDKPFFLYASYHRPHPPLDAPQAYLDLYANKPLPEVPVGDWAQAVAMPHFRGIDSPCPLSPAESDRARRAYYAQITFIDHQIGRLLHALHEHKVNDNTWIVFTSDHGDMLYDHRHTAKAVGYEGSARVPLIVKAPADAGLPAGGSFSAPAEMRDLFPTLCDIAGIAVPSTVEGRSLLPLCRGESPHWREYLHGEHTVAPANSGQWLTDGKWKYLWYSADGTEQLFSLEEDPQELHNRAGSEPQRCAEWRNRLIAELTGREEGFVEEGKLVTGRPCRQILSHLEPLAQE